MKKSLYILFLVLCIAACTPNDGKEPTQEANPTMKDIVQGSIKEDKSKNPPAVNIGRVSWQKPDLVISMLGDLSDKVVADIGASSGYFAFRLAFKAVKVIAVDIDPTSIQLMDMFKLNLPKEVENRFETRLVLPNNPMLADNEVDAVLIVNTLAYIDNRTEYLRLLRKSIKPSGQIMIVDYKMKSMPIDAPSMKERLSLHIVEESLRDAGFKLEMTDDRSLEYQYIVIAKNQ